MTPTQASSGKNEEGVYHKIMHIEERIQNQSLE